jgi:hypothetical protein
MPYSEAKSLYHLVDAEPLQESKEYSTAFMRAVSDGSILMAEMWRCISQAEIGFAWDAEQIGANGQSAWGGKCVTCGKPLAGPRFTIIAGPHCPTCLDALPGQLYNITAMLAFQVKARSRNAAEEQIKDLLAQHGLYGFVRELPLPTGDSGKAVGARRQKRG